jgi:hypothetical protein
VFAYDVVDSSPHSAKRGICISLVSRDRVKRHKPSGLCRDYPKTERRLAVLFRNRTQVNMNFRYGSPPFESITR